MMSPKEVADDLDENGKPARFVIALLQELEAMGRGDVIVEVHRWLNVQMQPVTLTKIQP
jgi:hypothetical protein